MGLSESVAPSFLYVPLGFRPARDGNGLIPAYPTGLPLMFAIMDKIVGETKGADCVMVCHALAGLVVFYFLAKRFGLPDLWAVSGAVILAASPLYLYLSLQAMSDLPSLVWTAAAVLSALGAREKPFIALATGLTVSIAVLLRPTNVLVLAPVLIALGFSPRRWLLLIIGGLPGALFFIGYSKVAYGSWISTGYDIDSLFAAAYVPESLSHYLHWLPILFTPVVLLSLGVLFFKILPTGTGWVLASWVIVFAGFYAAYKCTHETWWYLRYLLPAAPPMIIAGLLVLRRLVSSAEGKLSSHARGALCGCALLLTVGNASYWSHKLYALDIGRGEAKYGTTAAWMQKNLPANAVCLATQMSGALFYYTDFTFIRCEFMRPGDAARIDAAIRAAHRPLYAVLFPYEIRDWDVLGKALPGNWSQVGHVDDVTIWKRTF